METCYQGNTIMGRVPRGGPNRSVQSPVVTQRQFGLTHPESYVAPQIASLSLNVSEGPLENAVFHVRSGASVFGGPTVDAHGPRGSTWFDHLPPPKMDGGSVQTPRVVTRQTTHEQNEKTLSLSHPISRDITKTVWKRSFLLQDVGDSLSHSDEPPCKPEGGASVLETYFYYLHMLNKIRGLSSEERSTSVPFQGPRLSESESVIPSPEGKGRSKGASLDRETKEWRDGCESDVALEGERGTCPQGQGCVKETASEETSFWKPPGSYDLKTLQDQVRLKQRREPLLGLILVLMLLEHKRDADISQWLLLPDEIWICIFFLLSHKELARLAQVCRHFYRLASDESLWKQIQISDCCILEDDGLVALACRQPCSLTLHRCRHASQAVTDHGLKQLFQHCGDVLQELHVTSCSGPGLAGDKVLLHAGALCSRLTAVDMSWSGASDVGVMALTQGASRLHKIEVFGYLALTARSIGTLALQCPHLQTLNIGRVPKVSEACLVKSLENLREVTALNVAGLKMVRDQIVHLIVTQCPKLDSLVLSSCSQVTDMSLVEISIYLRTLRYFILCEHPNQTPAK